MSKKEEKQTEGRTQEKDFLGVPELEDILNTMEEALGSLGIANSAMVEQRDSDRFSDIENTTTRHAFYRLVDLINEGVEKLEKAHSALYAGIYPEHKAA